MMRSECLAGNSRPNSLTVLGRQVGEARSCKLGIFIGWGCWVGLFWGRLLRLEPWI